MDPRRCYGLNALLRNIIEVGSQSQFKMGTRNCLDNKDYLDYFFLGYIIYRVVQQYGARAVA